MTTKQDLHSLVEGLPDSALPEAERLLRDLQDGEHDPFIEFLMNVPEGDEPLTPADLAAIEEGKAEIARGEIIPWEEFRAQSRPNQGTRRPTD